MYFDPEAVPAEIPAQINRLVGITGWKPWKHRFVWLHEQVRVNPTMPYYLTERFGLELAFEQVRQHHKQTGRYPWPPKTAEQLRLYSFLAMIVRCHQRLGETGKTRLKGMIEGGLKSDYGIAQLAFEMKIVAQLMSRGFDVDLHDMEAGGGFDFLATNEKVEIEIECKFVSGDIGRQIHLKRLHQLGTVLLPEMANLLDQECGGRLIRVLISGRLDGNAIQHWEIRRLMSDAFTEPSSNANSYSCEVSISEFTFQNSPFGQLAPNEITLDNIQRFLFDDFEIENKNVLVNFSPKKKAVVLVVVESAKKDAVLKGIHHQLKKSASNQFSGHRPSILCCELADMTEDQLLGLKDQETGLQ